jgi:hypothetical protein
MSSSNDGDFNSEHAVPGRQAAIEALSLANNSTNGNISGLQPELEGCLLRDVLYAMQGIDGHYVRYDQQTEVCISTNTTYSYCAGILSVELHTNHVDTSNTELCVCSVSHVHCKV